MSLRNFFYIPLPLRRPKFCLASQVRNFEHFECILTANLMLSDIKFNVIYIIAAYIETSL